MKIVRFASMILLMCVASCANAQSGAMLDRSQLSLRFEDDFSSPPSFYDPVTARSGRWKTNFIFGMQDPAHPLAWQTRTLRPNGELQYYGDPMAGTGSIEWAPGALTLVGRANPYQANPRTNAMPYISGLITTETSFQQRYGYFEARVKMPVGKGLWPAFWLLPPYRTKIIPGVPQKQQEIDVFENVGKNNEIYATVHNDVAGRKVADGERIAMGRVDEPHDYGLLLTPKWVIWYIDSREVRRRANRDFHEPAYMLLNLAVGGKWPGAPDATTPFPARMTIYRVRAYALKRGAKIE